MAVEAAASPERTDSDRWTVSDLPNPRPHSALAFPACPPHPSFVEPRSEPSSSAAAIFATLPVRGADKRIVLIAGRPSHPPGMHEFRAGSLLLQKALSGVPGIKVDVYDMGWPAKMVDGARVDDSSLLESADAVLIYADGGKGNPAIQGERMKVIDALAAKGAGLGFGHYGVEVPAGVPGDAFQRWLGGYYETNWSVNPMWKPDFEKFPNHPVTRGVGPFATHDEWYFNMRWTPDAALRDASRRSWSPSRATRCARAPTSARAAPTTTSSRRAAGTRP